MAEQHRPKSEAKAGQPWTPSEVRQLKDLARQNTPTRVIGVKLSRPAGGVQQKASEVGVSLKLNEPKPLQQAKALAALVRRGPRSQIASGSTALLSTSRQHRARRTHVQSDIRCLFTMCGTMARLQRALSACEPLVFLELVVKLLDRLAVRERWFRVRRCRQCSRP